MEQGSYMLIERGMMVSGTDGDIGTVSEVVADESIDVFRGLVVTQGLLLHKQHFVPAERVKGVVDQGVQTDLSKSEAEQLPSPDTLNASQSKNI